MAAPRTTTAWLNRTLHQVSERKAEEEIESVIDVEELEELNLRLEKLKKIEQEVTEISQMMRDLKEIVTDQQPALNKVVMNIASANKKVNEGNKDLEKADEYQRNAFCRFM